MTDDPMDSLLQPLPCARVEALASEWVDGTLPPERRAAVEAHLDACEACANLVADLAAIASEAGALPRLAPTRDLWSGIAARIDAPVVTLDSRRPTPAPARRWWTQAAAAAALVVVTAGVTWRVTIDGARRAADGAAAARVGEQVAVVAPEPASPVAVAATKVATATREPRATQPTAYTAPRPRATRPSRPALAATGGTPVVNVANVALPPAAQAYDHEITAMRAIVRERRGTLDSATVRVLERNLLIIDQAITESRAALAQDPASGLLAEQLTRAMRRKLELLRTAADLPARTS